MPSCDTCYWEYNNQCASESLSEIYEDATFRTCDCVGWLRKDFEQHFWDTYHEIQELIKRKKCKELEEILEFIKNQRDADCEIRDSNKVLESIAEEAVNCSKSRLSYSHFGEKVLEILIKNGVVEK